MQDLLKEDEFIKKHPNPWRIFYIFYVIAFIQLVLFLLAIAVNDTAGYKTGLVALAMPTITAFTMFFFKKWLALLPVKTIALSLFILMSIYYIPFTAFAVIGGTMENLYFGLGLMIINYLFCFAVMYAVAKARQKKNYL